MADAKNIITEGERLLSALRKSDDGLTKKELQQQSGFGEEKTMRILHALKDAGRLSVGRKQITNIAGVVVSVVCYQVTDGKKKR